MAKLATTKNPWESRVRGLLKAELKKKEVSYRQLAEKLTQLGIKEKPENINNKINRGTFRASFLIQCLKACGCNILNIEI